MVDYYQILNVPRSATQDEVSKSYRKLALLYHPDRVPENEKANATENFKKIVEAYEVLGDPNERAKYDIPNIPKETRPKNSETRPKNSVPSFRDILFASFARMGTVKRRRRRVVRRNPTNKKSTRARFNEMFWED